jgi:trk system potassium uptake protein TrkA
MVYIATVFHFIALRRGKYSLAEENIAPAAPAINLALKDLSLPNNCVISGIIRHDDRILPRGITVLEEGDEVLAWVDHAAREHLARLLSKPS